MKLYNYILGLFTAVLLAGTVSLSGAPAKPGLLTIRLADGTSIDVRIIGDEHFHYYLSEDGYLLTRGTDDYFYYSDFDPQSMLLKATDVKAHGISTRNRDEQSFVAMRSKSLPDLRIHHRFTKKTVQSDEEQSHKLGKFPTLGKQKSLVILVQFKDKKFTITNPRETFLDFMMKRGFKHKNGAHGSVYDYYTENSEGLFDPEFDIYGPVTLPENLAYYGGNNAQGQDRAPDEMVETACRMLDDEIDFSQYDRNNDGWVDNVYIFYAGYSEAEGASSNAIWPHSWDIWLGAQRRVQLDDVYIGPYGCSNELNIDNNDLVGIGVFCHEFGHVLGLPDIYATDYNPLALTPGQYTLMDAGEYNNNSNTPPLLSAYERWVLGWHTPELIDRALNATLPPLSSAEKKSYLIKTTDENEMYFLENRQQEGYDQYLPGHGMLVWHIDFDRQDWENNRVNNLSTHQGIDLVEADGIGGDDTRAGDPFPGSSGVTEFTDNTYPSMRDWNNNPLNLPLTKIKEENGIITFKVLGGIFELDKVSLRDPLEVTATSFTIQWSSVARANDYLLNVYSLSGNKKEYVYRNLSMGNVNSYTITGLSPLSTYYVTVTASDRTRLSEESNVLEISTLEPDFSFYTPTVLPATEIKSDRFTANWEKLDEATTYYLSVYEKQNSGTLTENLNFTDGTGNLPQGWETSCNSVIVAEGYYGMQPPALRMGKNIDYLTSPLYNGRISELSFWYRGQYFQSDNTVSVSVFDGKEWQVLDFLQGASGEEKFALYGDGQEIPIGKDISRFRIYFEKVSQGFIYFDDIRVTVESKEPPQLLPGYDRLVVGDTDSYEVKGLDPLTSYLYVVRASDGTKESLSSPEEEVTTLNGTGMTKVSSPGFGTMVDGNLLTISSAPGEKIAIYSVTGILIRSFVTEQGHSHTMLEKGIYLVKCGNNVRKVSIR